MCSPGWTNTSAWFENASTRFSDRRVPRVRHPCVFVSRKDADFDFSLSSLLLIARFSPTSQPIHCRESLRRVPQPSISKVSAAGWVFGRSFASLTLTAEVRSLQGLERAHVGGPG